MFDQKSAEEVDAGFRFVGIMGLVAMAFVVVEVIRVVIWLFGHVTIR